MHPATFKRNTDGTIDLTFHKMTQGKAVALCHAIRFYASQSAVCDDLRCFVRNAVFDTTTDKDGPNSPNSELLAILDWSAGQN